MIAFYGVFDAWDKKKKKKKLLYNDFSIAAAWTPQVCSKPDDHALQHDLRRFDLLSKVHTGQCHNCSYVINGLEIVQNLKYF